MKRRCRIFSGNAVPHPDDWISEMPFQLLFLWSCIDRQQR
jgi:hypothetical protein